MSGVRIILLISKGTVSNIEQLLNNGEYIFLINYVAQYSRQLSIFLETF